MNRLDRKIRCCNKVGSDNLVSYLFIKFDLDLDFFFLLAIFKPYFGAFKLHS